MITFAISNTNRSSPTSGSFRRDLVNKGKILQILSTHTLFKQAVSWFKNENAFLEINYIYAQIKSQRL